MLYRSKVGLFSLSTVLEDVGLLRRGDDGPRYMIEPGDRLGGVALPPGARSAAELAAVLNASSASFTAAVRPSGHLVVRPRRRGGA